jgi:hypothetical protein
LATSRCRVRRFLLPLARGMEAPFFKILGIDRE